MPEHDLKAENQKHVLNKLRFAIETNRDSLSETRDTTPIALVAWLCRNLLELLVWAEYCRSSEDRAHEFLLDAARDTFGLLNIPKELLQNATILKVARQAFVDRAQAAGFDVEESYLPVSNAAKALGRGVIFKSANTTFSKFAHPTAMAVISEGSNESKLLLTKFRDLGLYLANAGLMYTDLTDLTSSIPDPFAYIVWNTTGKGECPVDRRK